MASVKDLNDPNDEEANPLLKGSQDSKNSNEQFALGSAPSQIERALSSALGLAPSGKSSVISFIIVTLAVLQWWFFNIAVVVLNKWIFQEYVFMFPMTLTVIHFLVSWAGAHLAIRVFEIYPLIEVPLADRLQRIAPLAAVTCFNIVLGNVSLRYIPVSFVQTIKALVPATTVLMQSWLWSKRFPTLVYISLLPIVGGMFLASVTEMSFVLAGFLAALTSCFVTSLGVILAEILLSGVYKFDSINTVYHMIPISFWILLPFALVFEAKDVLLWFDTREAVVAPLFAIILSGFLAFGLNFSLYAVIKATSAITFTVVGNFKVAVAVLGSWLVFRNPMNFLNVLGCAITIAGCTYYGYLKQALSNPRNKSSEDSKLQSTALELINVGKNEDDKS